MANGWTDERRQMMSKRIQEWQPWAKSSGPKTDEGKAAAAKNSFKHGTRTKAFIGAERTHNAIKRFIKERTK